MRALGRCWAAVRHLFTAVPGIPERRLPPAPAAAAGDELPGLGREILRHPRRLAAACVATVVGPAAVAVAGLLDPSAASDGPTTQPAALATPLLPPIAGDSTSWVPIARQAAETCPGLSSSVLVAIGLVESDLGMQAHTSPAGAEGPMQFLPSTWAAYGADGDGDGTVDVMNPVDAVHGAARLLCANGGGDPQRLASALWNYNHSDDYVRQVMAVARLLPAHDREPVRS